MAFFEHEVEPCHNQAILRQINRLSSIDLHTHSCECEPESAWFSNRPIRPAFKILDGSIKRHLFRHRPSRMRKASAKKSSY